MNVSQQGSTAPDSFNNDDGDGVKSPASNLGKRSRNRGAIPYLHPSASPTIDVRVEQTQTSPTCVGLNETSDISSYVSHAVAGERYSEPSWSTSVSLLEVHTTYARDAKHSPDTLRPLNLRSTSGQPPLKKLRPRSQPCYEIDFPSSLGQFPGGLTVNSHFARSINQTQRPSLPIRLSNPELGATMLSTGGKEDSAVIRTLRIARGSINVGSPSRGLGSPSTLGLSKPQSPDEAEISIGRSILNEVGVTELLEQDDRPTFIIDVGNQTNFEPGRLKCLYANDSLRAIEGLLDQVTGRFSDNLLGLASATAFNEFKAWSTSYVKNHELLNVALPSFFYGGITWTSCSLRKRLRLIRGTPNAASAIIGSYSPSVRFSDSFLKSKSQTGADSPNQEPTDYFGSVFSSTALRSPLSGATNGASLSVESPGSPSSVTSSKKKKSRLNGKHIIPVHDRPESRSGMISQTGKLLDDIKLRAASAGEFHNLSLYQPTNQGCFDWTRLPNSPALPPHIQFARSIDWASGPLGPIEEWSSELRGMCNLVMACPHPAAIYWGKELVSIYNEAYILIAGLKHPRMMGQSYSEAWSEIWDEVKHIFNSVRTTGQAIMKDDDCLFIERSSSPGFLEETYFSWSLIPLVGADGTVVGIYNPAFEKTKHKVAERRMLTLREVGERTAAARDLKSFWTQVLRGLEFNEYDAPFVLLYSVEGDADSDTSSLQSSSMSVLKPCVLKGTLGVPNGHRAAPERIDLQEENHFFSHVFREAMKVDKVVFLHTDDGTLDAGLLEGIERRGFGDFCKAAVCCPIHLASSDSVPGFLVIGVNSRRPYDNDYNLFIQLLSRQIAASMASVVLFEEEIAKGRRAAQLAAIDRTELSAQLAARTQEAVESETKFTRMAALAPVGIFIADSQGYITFCNDTWYEISRVPREKGSLDKWMDFVKNEDKLKVKAMWYNLVSDAHALNTEFRFETPWQGSNGEISDTWVLASAYPEKNNDGSLKCIFGSITNISQQKWAEHFEKQRMEEAVETKRQQENFIDITSHEMRNPLSAILQCADEISTTLLDFRSSDLLSQELISDVVDNSIDAAQTIALCAQHQKRIVDDILTLSKIDSALLLVTPCDVMPLSVVQRALKMFVGEVQKADIRLNLKVDQTMQKLKIDWVKLDPSRLLQVLINLTTNAIKFTKPQEKRVITVTIGASTERPSGNSFNNVSYFPTRAKRKDLTKSAEWGGGEKVFIHFAVQDTGRGLTEDETKLLFHRFSQASPRTHVQYGGSGLGLFISRELVELQGGEIGVSSRAGEGSTFAFYVKARRSTASADALNHMPSTGQAKSSANAFTVPQAMNFPLSPGLMPRKPILKESFRIMIVEDNPVNQRVLQKQLRNLGCIVYVANHGGECLDQLKESTFWTGRELDGNALSVILMDLEMPVMNGLVCARKIRDLQREGFIVRHVPIIAVSANARTEQIDTALDVGMVSSFTLCSCSNVHGNEVSNLKTPLSG